MARFCTPSRRDVRTYRKWLAGIAAEQPQIHALAEQFDPWSLFRYRKRWRGTVRGFMPGQTIQLSLHVGPEHNLLLFGFTVLTTPDELEPCEPPAPHELVGWLVPASGPNDERVLH